MQINTNLIDKYVLPSKNQNETSLVIIEEPSPTFSTRSTFQRHILLSAANRGVPIIILSISRNPIEYVQILQGKAQFQIIDCFTNPVGWLNDEDKKPIANTKTFDSFGDIVSLHKFINSFLTSENPSIFYIDSLENLMLNHGATSVLRMIRSIIFSNKKNIRIIASIQSNCCSELDLKKVRYSCETNLKLTIPSSNNCDIEVEIKRKHLNGKLTRSVEQYKTTKTGILEYIGSLKVQESEIGNTPKKKIDPTANLTFNLKLTDEEKTAKESVVLPYTHHLHQKEDDGTVDTDEEDEDFEDPDDDLDI